MPAVRDLVPLREALRAAWRTARAAGLSEETLTDYSEKVGLFVRFLEAELDHEPPLADFTIDRATDYMLARRHQRPLLARDTKASDARTLRAASKWFWKSGETTHHRLAGLPIPGGTTDDGRILYTDELTALFDAARGHTAAAVRNIALLGLLLDGGCRAAETSRLDARLYRPAIGVGRIAEPGKRGPQRRFALDAALYEPLRIGEATRVVLIGRVGPIRQPRQVLGDQVPARVIAQLGDEAFIWAAFDRGWNAMWWPGVGPTESDAVTNGRNGVLASVVPAFR